MERLRRLGIRPVLATGDRLAPAGSVAAALKIDEVHARCTPEDKAALVQRLKDEGAQVAVVGDGSTPPRSPPPTSASPWAAAPTWPSARPA
ncbi:hypothetical protein GCM10023100_06020 [Actinocorallia cavernae]|uniref:HAD family hydrolase n=2 Tax=Actinomycetes TaxID=1760 RepID=A0ABP8S9B1_9ACTN